MTPKLNVPLNNYYNELSTFRISKSSSESSKRNRLFLKSARDIKIFYISKKSKYKSSSEHPLSIKSNNSKGRFRFQRTNGKHTQMYRDFFSGKPPQKKVNSILCRFIDSKASRIRNCLQLGPSHGVVRA